MKLRKASISFSVVLFMVLLINAVIMMQVKRAHNDMVASENHRVNASALTRELRQESEQLARLVRIYTVTAEARYLLYYYDIVAIRKGEKAVPADFSVDTYWDQVIAGRRQHAVPADGEKRSLAERMQSLGFSAQELSSLNKVLASTEAMNQVEQVAFAATQGLYDPETEEFVSDGKPHLDFASKLVHGDKYNQLKADVSDAIEELAAMVDRRTNTEVAAATERMEQLIWRSLAFLLFTLGIVFIGYRVILRQVLRPIGHLSDAAQRLASGDYRTRVGTIGGVEEIVSLGGTVDNMAQSIQDDIRRRALVQEELGDARLRAEEATRTKSMFLANMSHEIRTPMNAIIGMAFLALKTELTTRQRDYVDKIHQAAKSLLGIINDILDFSKIEAGKLELENVRFRVEDVVTNAIELLRHRAEENQIDVLLDIDPLLRGDSGAVIGDPLRVGQILTNLLTNAVKFTHVGSVRLQVGIDEHKDDSLVLRFVVRDTGIGMSSEQLGRLFQEFTQADGSTTRKYGGTGLGLAIAKRFVELMGGQIRVESTPGTGSIFTFTACFERVGGDSIEGDTASGTHANASLEGMRVLLVEDNPINRQLATEIMALRGVQVDIALHGQDALEKLAAVAPNHYHAVLMDLQMPVMDGYEATRLLRAEARYAALPIIAMTAHAMPEERERCLALGMVNHIGKPIEPDELYGTLALYFAQSATHIVGASPEDSAVPNQNSMPGLTLPIIDGLDTVAGLRRAVGEQELYLNILASFVTDHLGFDEAFSRLLAAGQWNEAQRLAHTLKGLAGTIGAHDVQELVTSLENACVAEDSVTARVSLVKVQRVLAPLVAALQHHLAIRSDQASPANRQDVTGQDVSDGTLPACLPHLRQLLAEGDSESVDLWQVHRDEFTGILPLEDMKRINTAMNLFDFDVVLALLPDAPKEGND